MQRTTSAALPSQSLVRKICILILTLAIFTDTNAAVQFGALKIIDPPRSNTNDPRAEIVIASNGDEAQIVWTEARTGIGSTTNIFGTRMRADGTLVEPAGRFLLPQFTSGAPVRLVPAGPDFFLFGMQTLFQWVGLRLGMEGAPIGAPIILTNFSRFQTVLPTFASNGKTILCIAQGFDFRLLDMNGREIARQSFSGGGSWMSRAFRAEALHDGNYLVAWEGRNFARVDGETGIVMPYLKSSTITNHTLIALGLNVEKTEMLVGYQLDGSADRVLLERVDSEGRTLASKERSTADAFFRAAILPYRDGWMLFEMPTITGLPTITSVGTTFVKANGEELDLLPSKISPFDTGGLNLSVARWQDQFLAGSRRVKERTSSVVTFGEGLPTKSQRLLAVENQETASIAASPNGYLAVWESRNGGLRELRGQRLNRDGSPSDPTPFTIGPANLFPTVPPQAIFDGTNFMVGWLRTQQQLLLQSVHSSGAITSAPPRVIQTDSPPFKLLRHKNQTLLSFIQPSGLRVYFVDQQIPTGMFLQGGTDIASNDEELLLVQNPTTARLVELEPAKMPVYGEVIFEAEGRGGKVASVGRQFLVAWRDSNTQIHGARIQNGAVVSNDLRFSMLQTNVTLHLSANADSYLLSMVETGAPYLYFTNTIAIINAATGAATTNRQILGMATNFVSIASAGRDFLTAMTLWRPPYRATTVLQSISSSEPAAFQTPVALGDQVEIGLTLDETRRYRIEESDDLEHWTPKARVVGGSELYLSEPRDSSNRFFRAVLELD